MFTIKRLSVLILTVSLSTLVFAQTSSGKEMSAEEYYLQENTIEMMIIRETSRGDSSEQKMLALDYIKEAIDNGNTGPDIQQALEYLSSEGTRVVARESGRVINNFPLVRRRAAEYLGSIKSEESRKALLQICKYENEPLVLQQAIKALGDIGTNENNETVLGIVIAARHFNNTNPSELVALATIDSLEKIAKQNDGINDPSVIELLNSISNGPYVRPVRERAKQLISDLRFPKKM